MRTSRRAQEDTGKYKDGIYKEVILRSAYVSFANLALSQRRYNASEHPIPFHKATDLGTKVKKIAKGEMPDQEDVLDNEDEIGEEPEDAGNESEAYDVSKDKLIKQPKAASKAKSRASSSKKK